MLLYTLTGSWVFVLSLKSTTSLCLIPSSLHTGQIWSFPLFVSPFSATFITVIPHKKTHVGPLCQTRNFPLLSLCFSLSFFLLFMQTVFASGSLTYSCKILHCHWTEQLYIYLCTMKMNAHFLYLHGTNIQNAYIRLKKGYLYIVVWQVSKTTS